MPRYSEKSLKNLDECHPDLRRLFSEVIKHVDCSIVEGYRGEFDQNRMFEEGNSQLQWPDSKHNQTPSRAVDVWPYPMPGWDNIDKWREFCFFVKGVAAAMGIEVVSGGLDWERFRDYPHWELK